MNNTLGLVVVESQDKKSLLDKVLDDRRFTYLLLVAIAFLVMFVDTAALRKGFMGLFSPEPVRAANLVNSKPEQSEIPAPARIEVSDGIATYFLDIKFGEGDTFTQTEIVPVTDNLVLPTILFKERTMGRGYVVNRPGWISLVDLDHLRKGTLEGFVRWEVAIWKDLTFSTGESEKGIDYTSIMWTDRKGDHQLDVPNGNSIRLGNCSDEVFVRFNSQGMPIFLESVPEHPVVYSVGFDRCAGNLQVTTMDTGDRSLPMGELNSDETLLWRHFHTPVSFK